MKLLVVSHACVTPINQGFYAEVAQATGWDISLIIPAAWSNEYGSQSNVSRWKDFHGEIDAIPVWKAGSIPLHVYKQNMVGLLKRKRPDAIYVHHEPYALATAQMYLANHMVDRCPIGFYTAQNIRKRYPPPFRWSERFVFRESSFAFPVTQGALDVAREKGYKGNAEILPLPVDTDIYHPEPEAAVRWRVKLGIPLDVAVVGYLGRLVEEKGLRTLLQALKLIQGAAWRLVLAGSGPDEHNLRALVSELGLEDRATFAGFVPHGEAPGLLSMFDVLVLPSETRPNWKEQFGRVIIEANACGTSVVGSDSGEIGNVLRMTGGGVIVPEGNAPEFSRALLQLIETPALRKELAATGRAAVSEKYHQKSLGARFVTAIQAAADQQGRS